MPQLFKCSFCGLNKRTEFLAQILDQKGILLNTKEILNTKNKLRNEINLQYLQEQNILTKRELGSKLEAIDREIIELWKEAKQGKKMVCSLCLAQSRNKTIVNKFTCQICRIEKLGKGLEQHISGWEDDGIDPYNITIVCKECQKEYALNPPADFYCPLTSNGRDDWNKPRFDCNCQVNI